MSNIDWDLVDKRFERWYKANQDKFHDYMFTDDDIARLAFYEGIKSAIRKPPIMKGLNGSNQD